MRILYLDIDSLRPDHLGCYGYHRETSPNIDRIAADGLRFDNLYISDAPCLPSRTALFGGRFGFHNGVVNHGGSASEPHIEGAGRAFESTLGQTSWMRCLRNAGLHTASISPFGERHSAWHWYANWNEVHNTGKNGLENADEIGAVAIDWIERRGARDDWFLHVNLWDPHTPYRTPEEFGEPFADSPLPAWLTEEVRQKHWAGCGPHSAREVTGYVDDASVYGAIYPRQPALIDSMDAVRKLFDGYDTGTLYADLWIGRIFDALASAGVLDETVIVIGADHGENLGELNIYGDHQTADQITTRVPLIVRWPGVTDTDALRGTCDDELHYHFDFAATMIELLGEQVPPNWDGQSFAESLKAGAPRGREFLVVSQGAWSCQRGVRFRSQDESTNAPRNLLMIRSYHDGHHGFPDRMLFDLDADPHEQRSLHEEHPELVTRADSLLASWYEEMRATATHPGDPFDTVLAEGGPLHTKGELPAYLERLREDGRESWADLLAAKHPKELE